MYIYTYIYSRRTCSSISPLCPLSSCMCACVCVCVCVHCALHDWKESWAKWKRKLGKIVIWCATEWRRPIGCLKLQVIFRKKNTNYRALLQKLTSKIRHPMDPRHPVLYNVLWHNVEFFSYPEWCSVCIYMYTYIYIYI